MKSNVLSLSCENGKFVCDECGKLFRTHIGLIIHLSEHRPDVNKLTCTVCSKTCNSLGYLRLHVRNKHPFKTSENYDCKECGKNFKWLQTLKNHIALKHDVIENLHICNYCDKSFLTQHLLNVHIEKHFNTRPYSCEKCGMKFKFENARNKHVNVIHSNNKDFLCSECGKVFKTKAYLHAHVSDVHRPGDAALCSYCSKHFKTSRILKSHIRNCHTQQKERKYICHVCHWKFYSPKDLLRHQKTHSKVKEYICPVCKKRFNRKDNLQAHIKRHKTN